MGPSRPSEPAATARRDAVRWEHKRTQSRALWERDKHAVDHVWPETPRLTWPMAATTPVSRDTTPPDTRSPLPPRRGAIRP